MKNIQLGQLFCFMSRDRDDVTKNMVQQWLVDLVDAHADFDFSDRMEEKRAYYGIQLRSEDHLYSKTYELVDQVLLHYSTLPGYENTTPIKAIRDEMYKYC